MTLIEIDAPGVDLSRLVERAAQGEEIVLARGGKLLARLIPEPVAPASEELKPRQLGAMRGMFEVPDDFDDPLPEDLLRLFYGEDE